MKKFFLLWMLFCNCIYSQEFKKEDVTILEETESSVLYQIEEYRIRRQILDIDSSDTLALKEFIKKNEFYFKDTDIQRNKQVPYPMYQVIKNEKLNENLYQNNIVFFVGDRKESFEVMVFMSLDRTIKNSVPQPILEYILQRKLYENCLLTKEKFPFVGRKIPMKENWLWATINDLQDKTTSERMNWTTHNTLSQAQESNEKQLQRAIMEAKSFENGTFEILSDKIVSIKFEEKPTKARKMVFLEKSIHPILKSLVTEKNLLRITLQPEFATDLLLVY